MFDWKTDPHRRFNRFGALPPRTKGDLAFLQHMIATTNVTGMIGVVMPHGVLFRGGVAVETLANVNRFAFDKTGTLTTGALEVVMFRNGQLTEGSSSNVFVVKNGVILAPPKDNLVLPGITYDVVIELAQRHGLAHEVAPVTEQTVRDADEIWVTSSTKEVLAVTSLDGRPVGNGAPGPVFRRMHALYQDFKRTVMRA